MPRVHAGDVVFFRRLAHTPQSNGSFEAAVLEVATVDSDVFHVGIIVDAERIVHSLPARGVVLQPLHEAIAEQRPDVLEVGRVDVASEAKRKAVEFAMNEVDRAEYNDLFTADCLNSSNRRSFYCCQLIACAYANTSINRESPFLPHRLNFRDKSGKISAFWFDYYRTRRRDVPQDQPGSHPSILQASPCVHLSALRLCRPDAMGKLSVPKNLLQTLHFVGGAYAAAGSLQPFDVHEPRTGKLLTTIKSANAAEVAEVARLAADAQRRWAARSWQQRGDVLREVGRLIRTNVALLAEWEVRDNGKPIVEAEADVLSCAETFEFFSNVDLSGQHLPFAGRPDEHAYTIREPFGVVAALGAFNYPIQTATWKIAPAVACGNAIIYKPSPLAPITSVLLAQLLSQAGVPDGLVNVVQGEGATGAAICECPDVRKISFTGSVATGKKIAQQSAGSNVKPVTLELGGKSACVVLEDADLEATGHSLLFFLIQWSSGQVCTNASKVLVHESLLDEFTKRFVAKVERLRVGDPFDRSVHVGASISADHLRKVLEIVDATVQAGARLLCGGKRVEVAGLEAGFFMSPAVLADVPPTSRAYREEIFGPVALIIPFRSDEEALSIANETEFGLAAGVFSNDLRKVTSFCSRLAAGNVYVNTFNNVCPWVPFGGFNQSGYGRENGKAAIENYSQIKSVFVNASGRLEDPFPSSSD
ncbi:Betaine-aldehyde dehydrogenase family protein [Aphelenchoides fujianensis]|nr:Betaine-aldehyde dehydrogenase family protein [Aphelenchoides fujianensis]